MALTVGQLRKIAENMLHDLEWFEDTDIVKTSPNTYRMGYNIMGTYDGFLKYDDIQIEGHEDEYEDEGGY